MTEVCGVSSEVAASMATASILALPTCIPQSADLGLWVTAIVLLLSVGADEGVIAS